MGVLKIILVLTKDKLDLFNRLHKNEYEVLGTATNSESARLMLTNKKNAIVVLDNTLAKDSLMTVLNTQKIPFLVLCDDAKEGFQYLSKGATDMLLKANFVGNHTESSFYNMLCAKINRIPKTLAEKETRTLKDNLNVSFKKIIAIGSSTGGTESIAKILRTCPKNSPPIVIVQHMPPVFTELYAKRLDGECKISVWEARDMDELKPGLALIAPGDKHMSVEMKNNKYVVRCTAGAKVSGHCPSVDVLFKSMAKSVGDKGVGVILTGMGADGAYGLLEMRKSGAFTIGQDQTSSIVYGMPKVAHDIGAVCKQSSLELMSKTIYEHV